MIWIIPILFIICLWFRLGFWNRQPIRHTWNLYQKGILLEKPLLNKFVVPQVSFHDVTKLCKEDENDLYEYVNEKQPYYYKKSNFMGYLKKGYVSIYKENNCIRGYVTGRPVDFTLDGVKTDAFSTDFLYAESSYILKCLIQSHEYKKHKFSPVSIFTSLTNLRGIVPITTYDIQWVYTRSFQKFKFPLKTRFVKASPSALNDVYECFQKPFQVQMTPSPYTLSALIETKNVSIYSIYNPYLVAILFFKNMYELENDFSIVDWIGTILVDKSDMEMMHKAISTVLHGIHKTFKIVRIHQVSHTPTYTNQYKTTTVRKYAYNYGIYSIPSDKCFFL